MRIAVLLLLIVLVAGCEPAVGPSGGPEWLTDYATARDKARAENRLILMNFTGSDWCGWCKRLQAEVFSKPRFREYADANLVLLEIDFPRNKPQRADQTQANQTLAQQFKVQGFPTLFVVDGEGRTLGTTGYVPGGAEAFIRELKRISTNRSDPAEPGSEQAASELRLGGISGPAGNRLALINNSTVAAGESTAIKTSQGRVQVRCIAIFDDLVIVSVDGEPEPVELRLSGRL